MSSIIERFKDERMVVNCKTEEQAKEFIEICYENDMQWGSNGRSATFWDRYEEEMCYEYDIRYLYYSSKEYFGKNGYQIITFDEFMEEYTGMKKQFTKDDLKPGMLVEYRDGDLRLVMPSKEGLFIITNDSYNDLKYYDDDLLESEGESDLDIVKVYDVANNQSPNLDSLLSTYNRELLWEREEVKELTVEEISKLLGYKVRVVGGHE